MDIINFEQVNFIREKKHILSDINWQIESNENWAILGLNGSGKTTLLQLMCGYLWPSTGQLTVLGEKFGHTSIPELRKKIGWVSSALQYQIKEHQLSEKIVLSGKFASIGVYEKTTVEEQEEAKHLLVVCGGESLIGKRYGMLSQGERQTVLIARALMAKPKLLILDEPCNGLDLFARERLLQRIEELTQSKNSPTLLYVSHHTEEILPCFQKLLLLRDGKIVEKGATKELLTEKTLNAFYPAHVKSVTMPNNRIAVYPA